MTDDFLANLRGPRTIEEPEWRVLYALKDYQLAESILKALLCMPTRSEEGQEIPPQFTVEQVKDCPLGILVKKFKKVSNDTELLRLLGVIADDRNLMAHQALITQNNIFAEMIGAEVLTLESIREMDRRAMKAMTALVCAFIKSRPATEKQEKDC